MNRTALVVDDDPSFRIFTRAALGSLGFEVLEAADGYQALEIVEQPRPLHLVCLDLMLPGLPGLEVCERIRSLRAVPVLVLTARSWPQDVAAAKAAGAGALLVKPVKLAALREAALALAF